MLRVRSISAVIAVGAIIVLLFVASGIVFGAEKKVAGTKHDVATPGTPVCVYCHGQQNPEGETLWAQKPNTTGQFSGLKPLCFSCHDGTVTAVGNYVFDTSRPEHFRNPGIKGQDCDRCHDPHEAGYSKFIKLPGGANFCQNCHAYAGSANHPTDVDARAAGITPADGDWNPYASDFSGTRLWDQQGTGPGSYVKCLTCHSPHGSQPGTAINTIPFSMAQQGALPLCQNCHYNRSDR